MKSKKLSDILHISDEEREEKYRQAMKEYKEQKKKFETILEKFASAKQGWKEVQYPGPKLFNEPTDREGQTLIYPYYDDLDNLLFKYELHNDDNQKIPFITEPPSIMTSLDLEQFKMHIVKVKHPKKANEKFCVTFYNNLNAPYSLHNSRRFFTTLEEAQTFIDEKKKYAENKIEVNKESVVGDLHRLEEPVHWKKEKEMMERLPKFLSPEEMLKKLQEERKELLEAKPSSPYLQ